MPKMTVVQKTKNNGHFVQNNGHFVRNNGHFDITIIFDNGHFEQRSLKYSFEV